jgi:hypothetical protein
MSHCSEYRSRRNDRTSGRALNLLAETPHAAYGFGARTIGPMTRLSVRRIAILNVGTIATGWSAYAISTAVDAHRPAWFELLLGAALAVTTLPLIAYGRRLAGGGRTVTAAAFAGEAVALAAGVVGVVHGASAAHQNEVALLSSFLVLPWYAWFGLCLRTRRTGRAALVLAAAAALLIAARPLTSSAVILWALVLAGLVAYSVWALALPAEQPVQPRPARRRSRGGLAAHSVWLVLVLLLVAPQLGAATPSSC